MEDTALELRLKRRAARELRVSGPGEPPERRLCEVVDGRWETPATADMAVSFC